MKYRINPETKRREYKFDYMTRDELIAEIEAYTNNNKYEIKRDLKGLAKSIKNEALKVALSENKKLAEEIKSLQEQLDFLKEQFISENDFLGAINKIRNIFICKADVKGQKPYLSCGYTKSFFSNKIKKAFKIIGITECGFGDEKLDISRTDSIKGKDGTVEYYLAGLEEYYETLKKKGVKNGK